MRIGQSVGGDGEVGLPKSSPSLARFVSGVEMKYVGDRFQLFYNNTMYD